MRASTICAVMVGATLSVAPIFSLVWAQQSNQQASLLLEMQALRGEIAELRDMVERQDHQLRQMQKAGQARPAVGAGSPVYRTIPSAEQAPADRSLLPVQDATSADYPASNPIIVPDTTSVDAIEEEVAPAFAEQEAAFYQPYPAVDTAGTGGVAPVDARQAVDSQPVDGVLIEDRVIGPRPVQSAPQSQRNFPPVEDRRVGAPGPSNPQPQVMTPADVGDSVPAGGGVIAVPIGNTTVADQGYPTPPQIVTTTPGRQNTVIAGQGAAAQAPSSQTAPAQTTPASAGPGSPSPQPGQAASVPATVVTSAAAIPTVLSEQDYYQQGFELLKQSKHAQAVDVFKQQISNYPQGVFADDAHYWIAESMYVNRDLNSSKRYFKAIIDGFAQSPRLPDAMLKTAYIEQEQGNQIEARILLQEIIQYHPRSNAAISAKNRLAEIN